MGRFELHVHTKECDKCASMGGADIVHHFQKLGYDGMVVTDHYIDLFHEWFADELLGKSYRQRMERWLKGYYTAREEGEKCGFTVLPGAEVRFDGQPNDYLIYGVSEDFFYEAPPLNHCKTLEELTALLPTDACVVQAHPFRDSMTVMDPKLLFGLEVRNAGTPEFRNDLARIYAEHYQKAMTSGSDFHGKDRQFHGGILTSAPIQSPADLIRTLRSGEYTLL